MYDLEGVATDGPEAEELAAVASPSEPGLVGGAAGGTEVAPRVAMLCCLHQLAENAGTVWPAAAGAAAAGAGAGAGAGATTAAAAAAVQAPLASGSYPAAGGGVAVAKRRPVIVFGDASFWDEQTGADGGGDAAATVEAAGMAQGPGNLGGQAAGAARGDSGGAADADVDVDIDVAYGAPPPRDPNDPSLMAGRMLWRQLLAVGLKDPLLSTDKVRNGSELHRQKVRLWQALVVLTSFVPREECGAAVAGMLGQVNGNNPPTVKQYIEAVVAALVLREVRLR
jgi:hypothetical protein